MNIFQALAGIVAIVLSSTIGHAQIFDVDQYGSLNLKRRQSTGRLESVISRELPRFELISAYPETSRVRRMGRPVGRLDIRLEKEMFVCTVAILSAEYLLTNNHCVPGKGEAGPVKQVSAVFDYYAENGRGAQRFEVETTPIETSALLDYSILRVRGNPAGQFGVIKLGNRDPVPGEALFVVHHPAGGPKHVTRGGCQAGHPDAMLDTDIFHYCDTIGGSSGAPVFADDDNLVLALHYGGHDQSQTGRGLANYGKRITRIAQVSPIIAGLLGLSAPVAGLVRPPVTLTLASGARYLGPARDGKPHGRGQVEYVDGSRYDGDMVDGLRQGQGTWTSKTGHRWTGTYANDRMFGRFRVEYADGSVLDGADLEDGNFVGLAACNLRADTVYAATGFKRGEAWIGKGWYKLEPKQCRYLNSGRLAERYYYYRIELVNAEVKGGTHMFCLDPKSAFEMPDAERCPSNAELRGFAQIDLGEGDKRVVGSVIDIPK